MTARPRLFARLTPGQAQELAAVLRRGYLASRRASGGLFAFGENTTAGELFGLWCEANREAP